MIMMMMMMIYDDDDDDDDDDVMMIEKVVMMMMLDDVDDDDDDKDDDADIMAPFSSSQDVKTWFFSALAPMFAPKPPRGGCTGMLCTLVFWTKAKEVKEMHH